MSRTHITSRTVGLLGIGLLGSAIAERLLAAEVSLIGFDLDDDRMKLLATLGGLPAARAAEVVGRADILLFSLPTSSVSRKIVDECISNFRAEQTVIDTTTGRPEEVDAVAELLARHGVCYLEAMVAGSSTQLRQREAKLLLGGSSDDIARLDWLWNALAKDRMHVGSVGSACRMKLVHNHVLGLHRLVLAESLALAEAMGIDSERALHILRNTPAASTVMATKGEKMVRGDRTPQARLSQHLKDVGLILEQASSHEARVPLARLHQELLEQAVQQGLGDADNSAVIELFR